MSYEQRILKKSNFYLNKYKLHYKKYPNWSSYTKWIKAGKFPNYPFRVQEIVTNGLTSMTTGGNIVPQISLSKKRRGANLAGCVAIKEVLSKLLGKEPQVDQIGVVIALYSLEYLRNPDLYQEPSLVPVQVKKEPTPVKKEPAPVKKEPVDIPVKKQPEGKIEIIMPEIEDDDDWESMC